MSEDLFESFDQMFFLIRDSFYFVAILNSEGSVRFLCFCQQEADIFFRARTVIGNSRSY